MPCPTTWTKTTFGVPTALGLALSGLSCGMTSRRFGTIDDVIAWTFATTLVALLFGSPRIAGWKNWW